MNNFYQTLSPNELRNLQDIYQQICYNLERFVDLAVSYEIATNPSWTYVPFTNPSQWRTPEFSKQTVENLGIDFHYVENCDTFHIVQVRLDIDHFNDINPTFASRKLDLSPICLFLIAAHQSWSKPCGAVFSDANSTCLSDLVDPESRQEYVDNLARLNGISNWLTANLSWHEGFFGS